MAKNAIDDYSVTAASNTDIDGLDSTGATGFVKSGDNYVRSMMAHAKAKANDDGAVNTVGGTGDAITVTLASNPSALYDGMRFSINAPGTNTGAVTIAVTNSGATLLGTKKVRKWSGGAETALSAGDITSGHIVNLVYDSARDTAAGAFMIDGSASVAAATTSAAGIVELATNPETLSPPVGTKLVPTIDNLYFPTGHLYGLTLTNSGVDATNDIVVAAGTARDASDSYNYILSSAYTKQIDAAWALGSSAGGLDTGSVGNNRYAIWGIGRSDTRVCDVLFSTSFSSPTMPTNYDFKVLLGEFTRAGGVNGTPLWYGPRNASTGYAGITLSQSVASTSGTSIDFTGIPAWAKHITVGFAGVSTNGTSAPILQVGDSGGIETSGYLGATGSTGSAAFTATAFTTGLGLAPNNGASFTYHGSATLDLLDCSTNQWVMTVTCGRADGASISGGSSKSLSATLDRVRITTVGGADTFDAGTINISYSW